MVCGVNTFSNVQLLLIDGPLNPADNTIYASTMAPPQFNEPAPLVMIIGLLNGNVGFDTLQAQILTYCPGNTI